MRRQLKVGMKLRMLTILEIESSEKALCRCDCGTVKYLRLYQLGRTVSCGCIRLQHLRTVNIKHGANIGGRSKMSEYNVWINLKQRCLNPKNKDYPSYGGRGIDVFGPWVNSFERFLKDIGKKPTPQHCIERIDNDYGYYPENCRWATHAEQAENRRILNSVKISNIKELVDRYVSKRS